METQAYLVTTLVGRYILIIVCFLVFIQAILEIRKASQSRRYIKSDSLASLKWLRKKSIYELDSENVVGKSGECDIIIKSPYLKRKHFRLYLDAGEWIIEPYKNRELKLNKEVIEEKGLIEDGDQIKIGKENFVFIITPIEEEDIEDTDV